MQACLKYSLLCTGLCVAASAVLADEIKLKDGKKLDGVIVGYEDNMFRVKTDFGFVLVEKDKIASIVPTGATGKEAAVKNSKTSEAAKAKGQPSSAPTSTGAADAEENQGKARISDAAVKPSLPAASSRPKV